MALDIMQCDDGRMETNAVDTPVVGPLRAGAMTSAGHQRLCNVITRALGNDQARRPDAMFAPAPVGRVLLCSDGSTAELGPTIGRVVAGIDDPRAAADRPVELTLRSTARGNAPAVVVPATGDAA